MENGKENVRKTGRSSVKSLDSVNKTPFADQTNTQRRKRFNCAEKSVKIKDKTKKKITRLGANDIRSKVLKKEVPSDLKQLVLNCVRIDVSKIQKTSMLDSCPNGSFRRDLCEQTEKKTLIFPKELIIKLENLNLEIEKESQEPQRNTKQKVTENEIQEMEVAGNNKFFNTGYNALANKKGKAVTFDNVRNLRKRDVQNYAEQSLDSSECVTSNIPIINVKNTCRLPIYKNIIEEKESRQSNLYDFNESDFDDGKQSKQVKTNRKFSMFDKTTHEILQKIEKKEAIQHRKRIKRRKKYVPIINSKSSSTYQKTVKNIIQSILPKIKRKKNNNIPPTELGTTSKVNTSATELRSSKVNTSATELGTRMVTGNLSQLSCEMQNVSHNVENEICQDTGNQVQDNDIYFGFNENLPGNENAVNIISNVVINNHNIDSPSLFHHQQPNANSTLYKAQFLNKSSPWRFYRKELKRNPHFLELKSTSLPSITQEPIIDHTLDGSVNSLVHEQITPKKTLIQKSIVDYIDVDNLKENQTNNEIESLFNYEEFESPDKENSRGRKTKSRVVRKILQPRNDNIGEFLQERLSNCDNYNLISHVEESENKRITYFGFDNSDEEVNLKDSNTAPFRINFNPKKYSKKRKAVAHLDIDEKETHEETQVANDSDKLNIIHNEEEENAHLQLFDDPEEMFNEELPSPKIHEKKKRRRLSWQSDDESLPEKPRKKRKDVMTKSEEEKFEKWAAAFNSMCQEVEKHELEID